MADINLPPLPPISKNSSMTLGLVIALVVTSGGFAWKAAQILTEFDYVKSGLRDIQTDVAEIKRQVQHLSRQQSYNRPD